VCPGQAPADWKIVSMKRLTGDERATSAPPATPRRAALDGVPSGDRFFDHFDLTTLESPDYHPDGRDLGENYTLTSWRQSPCAKSGRLDCVHCHTSSGRYKFKDRPNDACLPCHEERVKNAAVHTRHAGDGPGTRCTDCHMPKTEFARMIRSDHSMRPPSPAATRAFGSPNACGICHGNRSVAWAEKRPRVGGGPLGRADPARGRLVARAQGRLDATAEIVRYLGEAGRDEIVTVSLARLLAGCEDAREVAVLRLLAADPRPSCGRRWSPRSRRPGRATSSSPRRGASGSSACGQRQPSARLTRDGAGASPRVSRRGPRQLERSLLARPDDFASPVQPRQPAPRAGRPPPPRYRKALALRPDHLMSLVNLSMAEARLGRLDQAEAALREALRVQPLEASAHFNLGLLLAERQRPAEAQAALRRALELDPRNATAAYNLAVLVADKSKATNLASRAALLVPRSRVAFTQAFYAEVGDAAAAGVLQALVAATGLPRRLGALGALLEGRDALPRRPRSASGRRHRRALRGRGAAFEAQARRPAR
jgi:hypothetical protein